ARVRRIAVERGTAAVRVTPAEVVEGWVRRAITGVVLRITTPTVATIRAVTTPTVIGIRAVPAARTVGRIWVRHIHGILVRAACEVCEQRQGEQIPQASSDVHRILRQRYT